MFELAKEIKDDSFFVLSRPRDKEKNCESPWGIEPQIFGFCAPMLGHRATETIVGKAYYEDYIWHASCILLRSVRIKPWVKEIVAFKSAINHSLKKNYDHTNFVLRFEAEGWEVCFQSEAVENPINEDHAVIVQISCLTVAYKSFWIKKSKTT